MDWRHVAACREVDPELFFPIGNSGPALLQIEEAKQVCRRCAVVEECLRWAIDSGQDAGVWGGLSEDERRALKRRTVRLRAGPASSRSSERPRRLHRAVAGIARPFAIGAISVSRPAGRLARTGRAGRQPLRAAARARRAG